MPTALSLHIGLNAVDAAHYGDTYPLRGCHNDARDMEMIARTAGYASTVLLDNAATATRVQEWIFAAGEHLVGGDSLLLTYAGHGAQVPDASGDEEDSKDETWVLFDRMLLDDEIYAALGRLRDGVRVLIVSDSCHSGSVARLVEFQNLVRSGPLADQYAQTTGRFRTPDEPDFGPRVWRQHPQEYANIARRFQGDQRALVRAAVIQISGCQDTQLSADGVDNGLFTSNLLAVWASGTFLGDHPAFRKAIAARMPGFQNPNYLSFGSNVSAFEKERPFGALTSPASPIESPHGASNIMEDLDLATRQADLEHEIIRSLVEDQPRSAPGAESDRAQLVAQLRSVVQQRSTNMRSAIDRSRPIGTALAFGAYIISEELQKIISVLDFLLYPAEGFVSWYNHTNSYVHVLTFDEKDAVRWVRYEERNVAPKQAVQLTARGTTIHVFTPRNGATYDCVKGRAYLFNGTNVIEKT